MSEGCRGCSGRCCYDIVVHVTPFDVHRLAVAQALSPLQIVAPREATQNDGPSWERLGARVDDTPRRVRSVLRKKTHDQAACQFLVQVGEQNRCGVYAERPRVCVAYPFTTIRGSIDMRSDARCGTDDWNMARLPYASVRRELAAYSAEWDACGRIVDAWNEGVANDRVAPSFERFIAYADRAAGAILAGDANDAEILERWNEALLPTELEAQRAAYVDRVSTIAHASLVDD